MPMKKLLLRLSAGIHALRETAQRAVSTEDISGRDGYVFLISVIFVGAIAMSTAATLVVLGIGAQRSGRVYAQSSQALVNAETCVERTLQSLRTSLSYAGSETITLANGTCEIKAIGGSGN
ncbi:MAG: Uncharacterized protein Greene101449_1169, partial [Candidatus Peregrinibacteria bacterium Greene1014_49]